jgi:hypothetical protein
VRRALQVNAAAVILTRCHRTCTASTTVADSARREYLAFGAMLIRLSPMVLRVVLKGWAETSLNRV